MMRIKNSRTGVTICEVDDDGNMRYLDVNGNEKKYPGQVMVENEEKVNGGPGSSDQV